MRLLSPFIALLRRLSGLAGGLTLRMAAFGALTCLTLLSLEGWTLARSRADHLQKAEATAVRLAHVLGHHSEDMLSLADVVLVSLLERVAHDGLQPATLEQLHRFLAEEARLFDYGMRFSLYGAEGLLLASSAPHASLPSIAGQDYFRFHRDMPTPEPYIGPPIRRRSSGEWILTLSRRLDQADGRFAGVAVVSIEMAAVLAHYAELGLEHESAIALFRQDGILLACFPFREEVIGQALPSLEALRDTAGREVRKGTTEVSLAGGVERISAYDRAERYPIVVWASLSRDSVLAGWRSEVTQRGLITGGLTLLLAFFCIRLTGNALERHRVLQALAESEASFRMLAENSGDLALRVDEQGVVRYASPAVLPWLGWPPEALIGRGMAAFILAEDREAVQLSLERMAAGTVQEVRLTLRLHRQDGTPAWAELALRALRQPRTGRVDGAVAIARDIGEHRAREEQLRLLANTDGLTGLANRRAFDEALDREWRRMLRGEGAMSLLLLDLDRFKPFNDRHGHPQGDLCLKAVAGVLASLARRPADLAVRYGGEEMALLLPDTDEAGAARIAEGLRAAVEALQWPHEDNTPFRVVTVSIGVATVGQGSGMAVVAELVAAADGALYRAKHGGRNRLAAAGAAEAPPRRVAHAAGGPRQG